MPEKLNVVQCDPHQQSLGPLVIFVRFSRVPNESLRHMIKEIGNGSYRQGPNGIAGWHVHQGNRLADAVKPRWPSFSNALRSANRIILNNPETIQPPSHNKESKKKRSRLLNVIKGM